MTRDQKLELAKYVGLGSLGSFLSRALRYSNGDRFDWDDRERFASLGELFQSAWRGAQPLSELTAVREQARMAAEKGSRPEDLPTVDQDYHNKALFLRLRPDELKTDDDVSTYVCDLQPLIKDLAETGKPGEETKANLGELKAFVAALAHVNDDVLERRRDMLGV